MRVTTVGLRPIAVGCALVVAVMALLGLLWLRDGSEQAATRHASPVSDTSVRAHGGRPELERGTKRLLGTFKTAKGHTIRISTARTTDGQGCLIEEGEDAGFASSCLEGGLFATRRAELMISSMGGPERFSEIRVVGVVASNVGAAFLDKSDGTSAALALNDHRAFSFESPAAELESGVAPSGLRLIGRNGRLIETIDIPESS
jgi:hypothetical protein